MYFRYVVMYELGSILGPVEKVSTNILKKKKKAAINSPQYIRLRIILNFFLKFGRQYSA
jgi:hypothetical protein